MLIEKRITNFRIQQIVSVDNEKHFRNTMRPSLAYILIYARASTIRVFRLLTFAQQIFIGHEMFSRNKMRAECGSISEKWALTCQTWLNGIMYALLDAHVHRLNRGVMLWHQHSACSDWWVCVWPIVRSANAIISGRSNNTNVKRRKQQ